MNKPVTYSQSPLHHLFERMRKNFDFRSGRFWWRLGTLLLFCYIMLNKDISIDLEFFERSPEIAASAASSFPEQPHAVPASNPAPDKGKKSIRAADDNLANTFSNVSLDSDVSSKKKVEKRRKMQAYVKQYAALAKEEMKKHGIPASITLAQGLLESDAGESRLAVGNNNHFGIKCFSRSCKKGHCTNYTDDTHKDFFRKYKTPADSFHAHSTLLKGDRYRALFQYRKTDYVSWAKGLKQAGYATDPRYDQKLINLIRELGLDEYDR